MSDIPALAPDRILRFHAPDKVFHSLNAITWFALLFTGMYVYFLNPSDEAAETAMLIHLILGAVFTFNLLGFIVIAPDRFALIMRACLEWDRNTIYWFRNFGGYPRRFFKIPFGPVEVPPQGRYNGGQKASYLLFMGMIAALAVTGWLLWIGAPVTGKFVYWATFYFHVWGSIISSVLVVCAHIPLALLSLEHFKGIWRLGPGTISVEAAEHHAPIWFERDVVRTDIEK